MNDPYTVVRIINSSDFSKLDVEKKYILDTYLVEAHVKIGNYTSALEILEKSTITVQQGTACFNVVQLCNKTFYAEVPKKMLHFLNISSLYIMSGNYEQALRTVEYVQSLFSLNANSGKEIPVPLLNSLIYLNIKTGRKDIALELLKKRRMSSNAALKYHNIGK